MLGRQAEAAKYGMLFKCSFLGKSLQDPTLERVGKYEMRHPHDFCPILPVRGLDDQRAADARLICIRAPFVGPVRRTRLAP